MKLSREALVTECKHLHPTYQDDKTEEWVNCVLKTHPELREKKVWSWGVNYLMCVDWAWKILVLSSLLYLCARLS